MTDERLDRRFEGTDERTNGQTDDRSDGRIEKDIRIDAPVATVWRYLEDPNLLAGWLMRNDFEARVDRRFSFFGPRNQSWDGVIQCRVIECDAPRLLAFTWNANDIGFETVVRIELSPEAGGTRLRLTHTGFDGSTPEVREIVRRHEAGWSHYLPILGDQLEESVRGRQIAPAPVDWTEFRLYVSIDATPDTVLDAWCTTAGMESFFVAMMRIVGPDGLPRTAESRAEPGDRFLWRWHNGRTVEGAYLAVEPGREVSFTFVESNVRLQARPRDEGGCLLELCQYGIPDTPEARMHIHANCRAAWVYFLTALKTRIEHGIDVRDRSRTTGSSYSTYFDPRAVGFEPEPAGR
ncbi:MAG: SRPBCC domain-containing protein [Candidatus Eisenbacteria bacterium]|uniref:SRPBCC domain-containing protein n=1 Tax=Eiseniibacteriota bacterium TaxID=2212470 RepID=A0A956NC65_UNCEI|nr:SRPBCC domain-containing protein [Candidatus Eisenbacteria bacterium]